MQWRAIHVYVHRERPRKRPIGSLVVREATETMRERSIKILDRRLALLEHLPRGAVHGLMFLGSLKVHTHIYTYMCARM